MLLASRGYSVATQISSTFFVIPRVANWNRLCDLWRSARNIKPLRTHDENRGCRRLLPAQTLLSSSLPIKLSFYRAANTKYDYIVAISSTLEHIQFSGSLGKLYSTATKVACTKKALSAPNVKLHVQPRSSIVEEQCGMLLPHRFPKALGGQLTNAATSNEKKHICTLFRKQQVRQISGRAVDKQQREAGASATGRGRTVVQLSKKELRTLQGHPRRFKLMGGRPEFHHVDRNKNGHIIEPTDKFQVVLTTSKNNVHAQVLNKARAYRTIFGSFAGNVGFRKRAQQEPQCAYRIGQNIARKCRRLGICQVDLKFRRIMRVEQILQAFAAHGLGVTSITHEPRLPKCGQNATKPRKRRRV